MRMYRLQCVTPEGVPVEGFEPIEQGDEDGILQALIVNSLRDIADLHDGGLTTDDEVFDLLNHLKRIDKRALFDMYRPTSKVKMALVEKVYEIVLVTP